jgi:1-aminocyclopropane-1-carboxylate deaminase
LLSYQETPVSEIQHPNLEKSGVRVLMKREDLNHPFISGNKWWKLKYNLQEALYQDQHTLLTYGGAFSNHIYATAAAAKELGLKSIGLIRGEETLPLNPTLRFAKDCGMKLHYLSRKDYREIDSASQIKSLQKAFGEFYRIPEGGTNGLAVKGCAEFGRALDLVDCNFICLPVGTGGTMAGVINGVSSSKKILGIAVLNEGAFLEKEIEKLLAQRRTDQWKVLTEYAFGGYARRSPVVLNFIETFFAHNHIPLDFIYTAKMMCAVFDLIEKQYFEKGSTILAIHTGGLQGHS